MNKIKKYLLVFLAGTFLVFNPAGIGWAQRAQPRNIHLPQEMDKFLIRAQKQYGLEFAYKNIPRSADMRVLYTPVTPQDYIALFRYIKLIENELQKYPTSFIKRVKIKKIYFVKKLFYKEQPVEGMYSHKYDVLFLDFVRSQEQTLIQQHNFHHEIYHVLAFHVPGYLPKKDPVWAKFNERDFIYGDPSNKIRRSNNSNRFAPGQLGFMSYYAMTNMEEDKAEIFACLMMKTQHKIMRKWSQRDPFLRKKVEYMKKFIQKFCSDMNGSFWKNFLL